MLYEISNMPSQEDLESAKGRLDDLGYSIVYIGKPKTPFQNQAYDLKDKTLCWIVKSELCEENCKDLPNTLAYFENNPIIEDIQKRILLKMWKEDPTIDRERLKILCIFNNNQIQKKVETLFREYLGPKSKQIIDSILRDKEHHISHGGYEFDIIIESYEIDEGHYTVDIKCEILPGGEVSIIMGDGRTLNLEDAVNDEEIGWEIKGEIRECIEDYLYKNLKIRSLTGFYIDANSFRFI
jgi:hypothetical protein